MFEFLSGCAGLFTSVFDAASSQEYFLLLFGFLGFQITFSLFCHMSRGLQKM